MLTDQWREFCLQPGLPLAGLVWEPQVVEDRIATTVDRLEFIIGSRDNGVPVDVLLDNLRIGARLGSLQEIEAPHPRETTTALVRDGQALAIILHPDSAAGKQAAAAVASAIAERTGVTPTARVGAVADRIPDQPAIILGNVDNNPAMLLLYARYLTPADSICPGAGGWLVHTVCDPFGKGANVIVAAASDDAGLAQAAERAGQTDCRAGQVRRPRVAASVRKALRRFVLEDDSAGPMTPPPRTVWSRD